MVAHVATSNRPDSSRLHPIVVRLSATLTRVATVMLLLLALWMLSRRIGGQLQRPLSVPLLIAVAIIAVGLASSLRFVWRRTGLRLAHWKSRSVLVWGFPSAIVLLLGLALSIAGTGFVPLLFFWSILLLAEGSWWWIASRQIRVHQELTGVHGAQHCADHNSETAEQVASANAVFRGGADAVAENPVAENPVAENPVAENPVAGLAVRQRSSSSPQALVDHDDNQRNDSELLDNQLDDGERDDSELDDSDEPLPDDVSQQITRTNAEDEKDTVTGLLRACFVPGARSRSLHVAFCPPMLRRPKVATIQLSGPRARIKVAESQPFGVRFDVRLARAGRQEQELLLHFEAHCGEPESPLTRYSK